MSVQVKEESSRIIEQIKKYIPPMRRFFDLNETLKDYAEGLYNFAVAEAHLRRQELVIDVIQGHFERIFGTDSFAALNFKLVPPLAFNIADHHQVLNHPALISSNFAATCFEFLKPKSAPIVVISSADVPPNNFFSLGGFQLGGKKVPIFSVGERELCSYYIPKRDFNFVARTRKAGRFSEFNEAEQKFLASEENRIRNLDFSNCQDYCDQISVLVKDSWPRLFKSEIRMNVPNLLYIPQEEVVRQMLIRMIGDKNIITSVLFDSELRETVINNFRGIVVAWRESEAKGTHFFWRKYPGQNRALRLFLEGGLLVPHDKRFKDLAVPLKPEVILDLLSKKEIYPSLFTIFAVLNFYCGIKPLVGYGSVMYLDLLKKVWLETLVGTKYSDEIKNLELVDTTGFMAGLPLFFERQNGKLKTLYGYDIVFRGGMSAEYLEKVMSLKFRDLVVVGVAEMYEYYANKYINADDRIRPDISSDDLAEFVFGKGSLMNL